MNNNKILKWLNFKSAEIIAQSESTIIFVINDIKYVYSLEHSKNRVSFLNIHKSDPQANQSFPDIKTLVSTERTQQKLIEEFEKYLNNLEE